MLHLLALIAGLSLLCGAFLFSFTSWTVARRRSGKSEPSLPRWILLPIFVVGGAPFLIDYALLRNLTSTKVRQLEHLPKTGSAAFWTRADDFLAGFK